MALRFVFMQFPKTLIFYSAMRPKSLGPRKLRNILSTYNYLFAPFLGSSSLGTAVPELSNSRLHQCLSGLHLNTVFINAYLLKLKRAVGRIIANS